MWRVGCSTGKEPNGVDDSDRKPLTGREKKIILVVAILTAIVIGAWIFAIIATMPEPSHGLL
jgi:hypothetical protein